MLSALCLTAAFVHGTATAQTRELPDFGSPADSVLSKSREAQLGRGVMLQLRNAGGIIDVALEREGFDRRRLLGHIEAIGTTLSEIFERARAEGIATRVLADRIAEERLAAGSVRPQPAARREVEPA